MMAEDPSNVFEAGTTYCVESSTLFPESVRTGKRVQRPYWTGYRVQMAWLPGVAASAGEWVANGQAIGCKIGLADNL